MRLIDVDDLGVGRCSKDVLPAAYCAGWNGLLGLIEKAPTVLARTIFAATESRRRNHMLTITIKANVPAADAQGIKERIAMDIERYGDCKVVSITSDSGQEEQLRMKGAKS